MSWTIVLFVDRILRKWSRYFCNNEISYYVCVSHFTKALEIVRLNSGIRNRHNFFVWAIFLFERLGTDSVNYADSEDIKLLVWFPGSSILKFSIIFWKCVGCAQMRGCNILKIGQCVDLITPVIFIRKIRGTYLILPKPGIRYATRKKFQIRFLLFVLYLHYFDDYEPSYFKFFRTGENFKFKNETVLMLF